MARALKLICSGRRPQMRVNKKADLSTIIFREFGLCFIHDFYYILLQDSKYERGNYVHVLLGSEERHCIDTCGGRRGSCEGRRVPLGQEAIRTLIFTPLTNPRVSVSTTKGRGDSTHLYQLGTREIAYEIDGSASRRDGRGCHVRIQSREDLIE